MGSAVISPEFRAPGRSEPFVGEVRVEVRLENLVDAELRERGLLPPGDVRRLTTTVLIDTGAQMLVLPQDMTEALGLRTLGRTLVEYADGRTEERPLAGVVKVSVAEREAEARCIVGPPGTEPLLGQVILEITDLLVDCARQQLVPRPESPFLPSFKVK